MSDTHTDSLHQEQPQAKQPGKEWAMDRKPVYIRDTYQGSHKLAGKVAVITGGDSGIGRAIAVHFAREGAKVVVAYLNEHQDAEETQQLVKNEGAECILSSGDVSDSAYCKQLVDNVMDEWGRLDILINNAGEQHPQDAITDISDEQLQQTFRTNIFSYYYTI